MAKFAPSGPASPSIVSVQTKTSPTITNTVMGVAGSETALVIPSGTVEFCLKARPGSTTKLQYSYTSGASGTVFSTIPAGNEYREQNLTAAAVLTLYVQSSKAGTILELVTWA